MSEHQNATRAWPCEGVVWPLSSPSSHCSDLASYRPGRVVQQHWCSHCLIVTSYLKYLITRTENISKNSGLQRRKISSKDPSLPSWQNLSKRIDQSQKFCDRLWKLLAAYFCRHPPVSLASAGLTRVRHLWSRRRPRVLRELRAITRAVSRAPASGLADISHPLHWPP